ncbi:MAG: hypothetical protein KAH11_08445 [Rhodospirillales bacterium]|nr:hypothetical protein [Rhodospirillales bacterium]
MFMVSLTFAAQKGRAGELMEGHKAWIQQGFDDGVFLMTGSLVPGIGGAVMAYNTSRDDLERRVQADPFVAEGVVEAQILEFEPSRTDARLDFLST